VICGGGIAGIEGLLRARRLAGDEIALTLLSPGERLAIRPLAVYGPCGATGARFYPLARIAADSRATWIRDHLERVDVDARTLSTAGGRELSYDAVLVAAGARESPSYEHVETFSDGHAEIWFRETMAAIERKEVGSVAFVIPDGPRWPVPLYVQRSTELSDEVLESLEAGQQAAIDAAGRFVVTVEEALPHEVQGTSEVAKRITESGLETADRLSQTSYDVLRKVIGSTAKSLRSRTAAPPLAK
jgi:hypothetical protein